ncbi:MAG TPA: TIGR04283 family arsenosugar biosynthesis glycosyltransferase [Terriglobales bacterium]|nr:TIGR04283 family arsenosugar biosynthesis glycosyltransferase [Terriglobales bacterium]
MISVVVPTYNEANYLSATLDSVADSNAQKETIVVDAGSVDGTRELAEQRASNVLLSSRRQRAHQMNFGAQHAHGSVLLFLHADTVLPPLALDHIKSSVAKDQIIGGGFARRYDSNSWFLRITCLLAGLRTRWAGWFLGDQAIFIRRETFERLGGFQDLDLFEDLDLSRRMAKAGSVVTLFPPVTSSSRRFKARGEVLTTVVDVSLTLRYLVGADPNTLAKARRVFSEEGMTHGDLHVKGWTFKS